METIGRIKKIFEEKSYGDNFKKREIVITTNETYPQHLIIEFHQDKCDLLNNFKVGDDVEIGLNLRGREWKNPEGEFKYFNSIQGWRIKLVDGDSNNLSPQNNEAEKSDDLPF